MDNILFEISCKFNQTELIEPTKYLCNIKLKNKKSIFAMNVANILVIITFIYTLYKIYYTTNSVLSTSFPLSLFSFLDLNFIHINVLIILFVLLIIINFRKFILETLNLKFFNKIFKFPNKYLLTNNYLSFTFFPPQKNSQTITIQLKEIQKIISFDSNLIAIIYGSNDHIFIKLDKNSDIYESFKRICLSYSLILD